MADYDTSSTRFMSDCNKLIKEKKERSICDVVIKEKLNRHKNILIRNEPIDTHQKLVVYFAPWYQMHFFPFQFYRNYTKMAILTDMAYSLLPISIYKFF